MSACGRQNGFTVLGWVQNTSWPKMDEIGNELAELIALK
jgi:hypothetical protein